ncbi:MAG: DUF58 domain-containing protein [Nitrospirae bacterium]|nr:DUF58 domain-containing protein [Nitrospirota bacterium]
MLERLRAFFRWFYRYRSIRLTPEGTRFVLLTLAVGVAAINTGNNLLYLLLAMMLSLIVMSGILSEQCLKQLDIRRLMPEHVFANRPTTAAFSIANRKARFPTFSLRVMDLVERRPIDRDIHLLHLPPRASVLESYPLLVTRRGRYRIEGIKLLTRFPFGLFIKAATMPLASDVVVYPELKPLSEGLVHDLTTLGHEQAMPRRGPGVALYRLRRYLPGDDSRTIHWKTTARQARLMVKETEAEDQRRVSLALPTAVPGPRPAGHDDPPSREQSFEQAVVLTASLAAFFQEQGFAIRMLIGDQEITYGAGLGHLYDILHSLALCQLTSTSESATLPQGFYTLGERTALGELTILVLPWADPDLAAACRGVSRIIQPSEFP